MHDPATSTDLMHTKKIVKDVHGFWGYEYHKSNKDHPTEDDNDFRFAVEFNCDIGVGYEALLFWTVREGKNLLVLNPSAFAEVASHSHMTFKLFFLELTFHLELLGYKITPVDY